MIRINLLPVREVEQASSRRKELLLAGGVIAVTVMAVLFVYFFQASHLNVVSAELERLEGAVAKIRKQNQDLEKMDQQKKDLEDKIRVVRLLTSPERRAASVHILDDLSASTPEQLWLTEFAEAKGVAKISGKAVDNQTIAAFARNLSGSRYFQKVEIRETSQEAPPAVDPRNRPGAGKPLPVDSPPAVSMTKFLIEVSLNYTLSMGGAGAPEGKEEGKGQKAGGSKPAKKTGAGEG